MEQPLPTNSGSLLVSTAALRFASGHCHSAESYTAAQTGRNKNGGKHSLTHLRATKVTRCVPYAPQPLSNSKEPNNAAPRVATRLKLQLREGSWSFCHKDRQSLISRRILYGRMELACVLWSRELRVTDQVSAAAWQMRYLGAPLLGEDRAQWQALVLIKMKFRQK